MAQFSWTDDLETHNALMDADHHEMVRLTNILFEAMESGADSARMGKAMHALIDCTRQHFAREEAEMERIQYVAVLAHHAEHAKLLKQIVELNEMLDAGGKINIPAVGDFLREWLHDHILAADMKLAAALNKQPGSAAKPQPH